MTVPTARATVAPKTIHCRTRRQSRGPLVVVRITPIAPNRELQMLGLNKNLRTDPPTGSSSTLPRRPGGRTRDAAKPGAGWPSAANLTDRSTPDRSVNYREDHDHHR